MTELRKTYVTDETTGATMGVDSGNNGKVAQHSDPDSSYLHMDYDVTGGTSLDIILIDLSDTTNYKHGNTNYVHLEDLVIEVDAEVNADYVLSLVFIENINGTDADVYEITHVAGTKSIGQQKEVVRNLFPNGPKCKSTLMLTSDITLNDTTINTATNLRSTYNIGAAATAPGAGDLILRINAGAGGANTNFSVEINLAYHTH